MGKQLTRLEKQIQRTTTSSVGIKISTDLKLKNSVFKPYQITKTSQTQIQENHTYIYIYSLINTKILYAQSFDSHPGLHQSWFYIQ